MSPHALSDIHRGHLFRKYLLLILSLVTTVLLISSAIGLYFSYQENKAALADLQHEKAIGAASRIEQYVRQVSLQLTHASLSQIDASDLESRHIEFLRLLRQAPEVTDIAQLDGAGREQIAVSRLGMDAVGSGKDRASEAAFRQAVPGTPWFGPVYFRDDSEPYMTVAVRYGGDAGPVTVAELNLKFIWDVVSRIHIGAGGKAYVVDGNSLLVADPDIGLVLRKTSLASLPHVGAAATARSSDGRVMVSRDLRGAAVLTSMALIDPPGWRVFVEQPIAEVYAKLNASILRAGLLLLAGLVISALAASALARSMVRPIRTLDEGARRIGEGELDQQIVVNTGDELEGLAEQFNRMSAQLRESYGGLERKVEQRTAELRAALEYQTRLLHEIEDKSRQLEIANRHKSAFLSNMSHELRTPLNAIIGFSEVLSEQMFGGVNDKQMEYLEDIHASGQHLLTLINDVLDLSKIEAGRMDLDLSCFDLGLLLDNALRLVRERALRNGLTIALEVGDGLTEWVADARKVKQIAVNLLSNAVKFTPTGGSVRLVARRVETANQAAAEISVADTGVGIAPEDHELVFEEFRQAGGDPLRKAEGTGLGLALARRFVELHGGTIRVDSRPGAGAVFTFLLPQHTSEAT